MRFGKESWVDAFGVVFVGSLIIAFRIRSIGVFVRVFFYHSKSLAALRYRSVNAKHDTHGIFSHKHANTLPRNLVTSTK